MTQGLASSVSSVQVEPAAALHVNKGISVAIVDQSLLSLLAVRIEVCPVIGTEIEVDETNERICRCDEKDT